MKSHALAQLWRSLRGLPSETQALPTAPSRGAKLHKLGGSLKTLNDEFATLNGKLFELKDALENLRSALRTLEAAKARRAEQSSVILPQRIDNTLN